MFIQTAQENMPYGINVKSESILNRSFKLTQAMFTFDDGQDLVKKYANMFIDEKEQIEAYVNEVLIVESRKMPLMVSERIAAKNR